MENVEFKISSVGQVHDPELLQALLQGYVVDYNNIHMSNKKFGDFW